MHISGQSVNVADIQLYRIGPHVAEHRHFARIDNGKVAVSAYLTAFGKNFNIAYTDSRDKSFIRHRSDCIVLTLPSKSLAGDFVARAVQKLRRQLQLLINVDFA